MKNLKKTVLLALCCIMMITTTTVVTEDYSINPIGHLLDDKEPGPR